MVCHIIYKLLVNADTREKSLITPKKVAEVVVYLLLLLVDVRYFVIRCDQRV